MRFGASVVLVDVDGLSNLAEMSAVASALQRQVLEHWAQHWGTVCTVRAATAASPARADEIVMKLLKVPPATDKGDLGVHDYVGGLPVARIFPTLVRDPDHWSAVASHELLEILGDPEILRSFEAEDGSIIDAEVCDRVESGSYLIDGVQVSNFNTPECFAPSGVNGARFDWLGQSTKPNEILDGGYSQKYVPGKPWEILGTMRPYRAAVHALGLSRAARRSARHAAI